ncbi:D-inositol 3-phosphate glycosyltransferase [Salinivirga cyanobacteriivorans]|uniref:D-inositol 3-phosphate glycosyltransferase n=1 Tax=Salinivirga cyanobacteriivorans TaxID=1307839 RepID=A0A0S2I0R5_9BACT|nr:glycosyltransferase family 1 protein [Salinivirga cyanobacteriivorans]ALO15955.1 D-inositol 3-phosphate glycosyltransferase [Salinivirga cyanobacteriivorans]
MRIAVNVRLLLKNKLEGIGWFTYENLKRITRAHPEHEFIFIFDRPYEKAFIFADNVKPVVLAPPTRHPVLYVIWFEFRLPRLLKRLKADLFLSPDGFLSLRSQITQLGVIHDINFAHRPGDLPWFYRKYYNYFFPKFARKANRLATVSQYSKQDIAATYQIDKNKIDVVYNGANEMYTPLSHDQKIQVMTEFSGGSPYFVFIGAFSARKNIKHLIQGFDQFKKTDEENYKLMLIGEPLFRDDELQQIYQKLQFKTDIVFLGRQSPENLHKILASARALTFVPFFEGFGIPVVESIQCEVPVLASNVTSVPEVAGDAAIYVNPESIDEIGKGMQRLATDETLYQQLLAATKKQKNTFTWNKSAERLWTSIQKVMQNVK